MQISREELRAAIEEAHKRGLKITGHLCSVTYAEAADLGIDNLEHGFLAATDFVTDKQPDVCPGQGRGQQTVAALDENGEPFKALVKKADRSTCRADVDADRLRDLHARPSGAARRRCPAAAAQGAVPPEPRPHRRQPAVDLHQALSQGARARARVCEGRRACSLPEPIRPAAAGSYLATRISASSSCSSRRGSARSKRSASARRTARSILGRDARVGTIAVGKQADLVVVERRPVNDDCRRAERRGRVQAGRRVRSREAD